MEAGPKPGGYSNEKAVESGIVPVGFTVEAKAENAGRILRTLTDKPYREDVENNVYRYLTKRLSDSEWRKLWRPMEDIGADKKFNETQRLVEHEAKLAGFSTSSRQGTWFSMYKKNPLAKKRMRFENKNKHVAVEVDFKEYFTLATLSGTPEGTLAQAEAFNKALLGVAKDLDSLAQKEQDKIQLKTPVNIYEFITHPDSLVIHFHNKETGPKVREIVARRLIAVGLYTARDGRTESGFDFQSNNDHFGGSHSELLARIVADHLIKAVKANPMLRESSPEVLSEFIDAKLKETSNLSPKEILTRINSIHSEEWPTAGEKT